ncbi:peptidyl-prolyl cis-trans isomerase SurA [Granulicella aggregans]|uniref:peptidylprolyl isomerase n=1 Tax=Granulicella aggregans TaxID=474949 RepID=A0A7W7ZH75_9BACT|nr:peptidylprolyl isomerase [Granulicella aggregans]MBB5059201.1 peptidyl-prolyl cis-trans isomerase SurA [Granulicella aggregans]
MILSDLQVTVLGGVNSVRRSGLVWSGVAVLAAQMALTPGGVAQTPHYQSPIAQGQVNAPVPQISLPLPAPITPNGTVVEDVIVQVNDQIINRSDLERAEQQLEQDAQTAHATPEETADRQKTLLRDLIDQQLLLSRGKELGINADAEVIRRLDEIRKQNKLESMEDLEKAARQQGVSFEDFKANIKNSIISQQVVRDEVGRRLQLTQSAEQAFYEAHKAEFSQPEQVKLSEILVPTPDNATQEQIDQAKAKADGIAKQIKAGDKFEDLAKLISGGQTAAQGGDLGLFKRGSLAKVLEDQTFSLQPGENTAPIRTRQGFVILKVTAHQAEGTPPLKDVEQQVQEAMYAEQMQPALRAYLTKLRENAFIDIKSGFVDAGSSTKQTKPVFSAYAAPVSKKQKKANKKRFDRGGGATNVAASAPAAVAKPAVIKLDKHGKPKKVKREKIRYGQSPEQALPAGPVTKGSGALVDTGIGRADNAGPGGSSTLPAPGTAIAPVAPLEGASTSALSDSDADPLAPKLGPEKKTRFSAKAPEVKLRKEKVKTAKAQDKAIATPVAMTTDEKATKQTQAAPLGLNGDTAKKKKVKRKKGEAKERLTPKPKDPNAPKPDENGVYPTPYHPTSTTPATKAPATDQLPPATAPAPGAPPSGDTTPATPGTPIPTPPPTM